MDGWMDGLADEQPGRQTSDSMNITNLYNLSFKYGLYF